LKGYIASPSNKNPFVEAIEPLRSGHAPVYFLSHC
jgi:hypothetical protein